MRLVHLFDCQPQGRELSRPLFFNLMKLDTDLLFFRIGMYNLSLFSFRTPRSNG